MGTAEWGTIPCAGSDRWTENCNKYAAHAGRLVTLGPVLPPFAVGSPGSCVAPTLQAAWQPQRY